MGTRPMVRSGLFWTLDHKTYIVHSANEFPLTLGIGVRKGYTQHALPFLKVALQNSPVGQEVLKRGFGEDRPLGEVGCPSPRCL